MNFSRPSRRQIERGIGREKLRRTDGCQDLYRRRCWAHRVLDTVAAGMTPSDKYIERALEILGDKRRGM